MNDQFSLSNSPLICILADKKSIFYHALSLFPHKALYANIVNDRRTSWFTSAISATDPFLDLHHFTTNCLPGYENTILDVANPVTRKRYDDDFQSSDMAGLHSPIERAIAKSVDRGMKAQARYLVVLPQLLMTLVNMLIVSPIWVLAYLISACIQTFNSSRRLREFHSNKKGRYGMDEFRLLRLDEQFEDVVDTVLGDFVPYGITHSLDLDSEESEDNENGYVPPPLALSEYQLRMIKSLNALEWSKFPVHITKTKAAHAAVIVRHMDWKGMEEGQVVISHWLNEVLQV